LVAMRAAAEAPRARGLTITSTVLTSFSFSLGGSSLAACALCSAPMATACLRYQQSAVMVATLVGTTRFGTSSSLTGTPSPAPCAFVSSSGSI
jgi:hypothetical protein